MQQNKDEEEECWNTKNTPVTDLEVSSQVTPVQAQGYTSDSNQSWRSPFSSAIELLKSRRIWPSMDNAVAVVIALSSSLWSKIRRMMMIIMIAFMISSSKLTVVAGEQYLHDLIFFFFFFFLPPLKQEKLVLVMEMRLFTQNPIITTTCGAQQIASRCGSVYVSPSVSSEVSSGNKDIWRLCLEVRTYFEINSPLTLTPDHCSKCGTKWLMVGYVVGKAHRWRRYQSKVPAWGGSHDQHSDNTPIKGP